MQGPSGEAKYTHAGSSGETGGTYSRPSEKAGWGVSACLSGQAGSALVAHCGHLQAMKKAAARAMRTTAWEALGNMGVP